MLVKFGGNAVSANSVASVAHRRVTSSWLTRKEMISDSALTYVEVTLINGQTLRQDFNRISDAQKCKDAFISEVNSVLSKQTK